MISLKRIIFVPFWQLLVYVLLLLPARNHRSNMVHLAIRITVCFRLMKREVNRPGTSTTIESLREYQCELGIAQHFVLSLGWMHL